MKRILLLLTLGALVSACGDDGPTAPSAADIAGTWSGTAMTPAGPSSLRLSFAQSDRSEVSGTWAWTVAGETSGGPLNGVVNRSAISASLRSPNASDPCRVELTATVATAKMTGTYAAVQCVGAAGGSIDLTKQ